MKRRKDPKLMAQQFNNIRLEHQEEEMNREQISTLIFQVFPNYNGTIPTCVRLGIILRVKHGHYKFPSEPIHKSKIETFYDELRRNGSKSKDARVEQAIKLLEESDFIVTYDPIIRNGVRLSEALKVAKKYGYTVIKN